jgi:fluoride ion exporter CrcB/FEX
MNCQYPLFHPLSAGFAGSLSTFAGYISEVLALIDPIIFKFDGFAYAIITVAWGAIIGFFSSQAKNWADEI